MMDAEKKQLNLLEEIWSKWEPDVVGLLDKYYFKRLSDRIDTLDIFLMSTCFNQEVRIRFNSAWTYRNVYETFRLNLISELSEKYGDDFYTKRSFFKIENSNYLKWLSEQSRGYIDGLSLKHFVIMGIDFVVDIVATEEPKFKIISK